MNISAAIEMGSAVIRVKGKDDDSVNVGAGSRMGPACRAMAAGLGCGHG
jgi:hypothetical protein